MNKSFLARIALVMVAAISGFLMAGCEDTAGIIQSGQNVTPVAADFTITGLSAVYDGGQKTVNIKPKTGKSQGKITAWYEGTGGTVYPKSNTPPNEAGKYSVTFDVAGAEGFNAVNGLKAGTLVISVKTGGDIESEDAPDTDDNYEEDNDDNYSNNGSEEGEHIEETAEPLNLVDFEDGAWTGAGYNSYKNRKVTFKGHDWSVSGITKMNDSDHYTGSRSIRFRGKTTEDADNINRIELLSFLTEGIEFISFDYASYGKHNGGKLELYCQKEGEEWVKYGEVTATSWSSDNKIQNAVFTINETGNIRFKIEKINAKSDTSVNLDNIVIQY